MSDSVNHEAFEEYMKISQELEDELIAEMGQEAYDASQHWINNPLIKNISKVDMFDKAIAHAQEEAEERILNLLPKKLWALVDGNLQPINVDALIKGENK